jgi:hypothetical protein
MNLYKFFGLSATIVREIDWPAYSKFCHLVDEWLSKNPVIRSRNPHIYIHKVSFESKQVHFRVRGIENRVSSIHLSVMVNPNQRRRDGIRFINNEFGFRLWQTSNAKHNFSSYKNVYSLNGSQLLDATLFEEYLATIVDPSVPKRDRKVGIAVTATATQSYMPTLKNVQDAVTTSKFEFNLDSDVRMPVQSIIPLRPSNSGLAASPGSV